MLTETVIIDAIRQSLSPDLLKASYRALLKADDHPLTGHCAVASEAFYHLAGGKAAGYMPYVASFTEDGQRLTHWWIRAPENGLRGAGDVIDITAAQFPAGFNYTTGRPCGFMQPKAVASKRAAVLIERVKNILGADAVEKFRARSIAAYNAERHPTVARPTVSGYRQ